MKLNAHPPGPCSIHVENLGPREAKFLGSIVRLLTDPALTSLACEIVDGRHFIGVDRVNGEAFLIDPTILQRPPATGRN